MGKNKGRKNTEDQENDNKEKDQKEKEDIDNNNSSKESSNNNSNSNNNNKQQQQSSNNNNNSNQKGGIVLGVYLHCQGCVETVIKSLKGFQGVEDIEVNTKDHRVIVKGNSSADPTKVADRLRKKSGKHVELISPLPKKQPDKKQPDQKKPETPKVVETVLKINLHCEGCAKDVKRCILKMQGVQTVNVDMKKSHVNVKGAFDPKNLVAYITKKSGRHAEIVNAKNNNNKQSKNDGDGGEQREGGDQNGKKENKEKEKDGKNAAAAAAAAPGYPNVPPGLVYAPQLFSDENPNACYIM